MSSLLTVENLKGFPAEIRSSSWDGVLTHPSLDIFVAERLPDLEELEERLEEAGMEIRNSYEEPRTGLEVTHPSWPPKKIHVYGTLPRTKGDFTIEVNPSGPEDCLTIRASLGRYAGKESGLKDFSDLESAAYRYLTHDSRQLGLFAESEE